MGVTNLRDLKDLDDEDKVAYKEEFINIAKDNDIQLKL